MSRFAVTVVCSTDYTREIVVSAADHPDADRIVRDQLRQNPNGLYVRSVRKIASRMNTICDACDGTGIEPDDPTSPCPLCEGVGWFGPEGFPADEKNADQ